MADKVIKTTTNPKNLQKFKKIYKAHLNVFSKLQGVLVSVDAFSIARTQSNINSESDTKNSAEGITKTMASHISIIKDGISAAKESLAVFAAIKQNRELLDFLKNSEYTKFFKEIEEKLELLKVADLLFFADSYLSAVNEFGTSWIEVDQLNTEILDRNKAMEHLSDFIKRETDKEIEARDKKKCFIESVSNNNKMIRNIKNRISQIEIRIAEIDAILATLD